MKTTHNKNLIKILLSTSILIASSTNEANATAWAGALWNGAKAKSGALWNEAKTKAQALKDQAWEKAQAAPGEVWNGAKALPSTTLDFIRTVRETPQLNPIKAEFTRIIEYRRATEAEIERREGLGERVVPLVYAQDVENNVIAPLNELMTKLNQINGNTPDYQLLKNGIERVIQDYSETKEHYKDAAIREAAVREAAAQAQVILEQKEREIVVVKQDRVAKENQVIQLTTRVQELQQSSQEDLTQKTEKIQKANDEIVKLKEEVKILDEIILKHTTDVVSAVQSVATSLESAAKATDLMTQSIETSLTSHIGDSMRSLGGVAFSKEGAGISSGSESLKEVNMWFKAFGGTATQKKSKSASSGFKSTQMGGTIGLETKINERNLMGIAFSHAELNAKFNKSDAKNEIKANILSAYWSFYLNDKIFLNSQAKIGKLNLKTKSDQLNLNLKGGDIFGIREDIGYEISLDNNTFLVPTIGFSYDQTNTKASNDNKSGIALSARKSSKFSTSISTTLMKVIDTEDNSIIPELTIGVDKPISVHNGALKVTSDNDSIDNLTIKGTKDSRMSFIISPGVKMLYGNKFELGINYQLLKRSAFISHMGTVKFKVKF